MNPESGDIVGATGGSPVQTGASPLQTGGSPSPPAGSLARRSIRLKGYDYSQAGAYFVTICTHNRQCLFGDILDGEMRLNDAGWVVANEWIKTPVIRNEIELDEWVVMPNHFHGILVITDSAPDRHCMGDGRGTGDRRVAPTGPQPRSVGAVMAGFKSAVTKRINECRQTPGAKLWQRNYWEHIVRNEPELSRIREYIHNNPAQWEMDRLHPGNQTWNGGTGDRRVAPTEIREPSAMYWRPAGRPNEPWML